MPSKKKSPKTQPPPTKRLYRSESNRVIAGVAAGLGEYFSIDPVIVRLLFLVITVSYGAGIIIYILLWIFLPTKSNIQSSLEESIKLNAKEIENKAETFAQEVKNQGAYKRSSRWFGIIVLSIGLMILLGRLNLFRYNLFLPLIFIIIGFALLRKR